MNDEIIKLTEAADEYADTKLGKGEYHPDWHDVRDTYFYRAAYNKAIEDAANVTELVGPQDGSLKLVTSGFAQAIRALEMKP